MNTVIAIDINQQDITSALWDNDEKNINKRIKTPTPKNIDKFYDTLIDIVKKYSDAEFQGIGFSVPGKVDQANGIISDAKDIPYLNDFPIKDQIKNTLGLPIAMETNKKCADLAQEVTDSMLLQDKDVYLIGAALNFYKQREIF